MAEITSIIKLGEKLVNDSSYKDFGLYQEHTPLVVGLAKRSYELLSSLVIDCRVEIGIKSAAGLSGRYD